MAPPVFRLFVTEARGKLQYVFQVLRDALVHVSILSIVHASSLQNWSDYRGLSPFDKWIQKNFVSCRVTAFLDSLYGSSLRRVDDFHAMLIFEGLDKASIWLDELMS